VAGYEEILYEVEDPVATITLNRPTVLNAWTDRMGFEVRRPPDFQRTPGASGGAGHT